MKNLSETTRHIALFAAVVSIACSLFIGCLSPEEKKMAFFTKGEALMEKGEWVKAKLEFKNAVQIDPDFAKAHLMLGRLELKSKNYRQAYGRMMKAVELDPDLYEARLSLGRMLLSAKALDRAKEQVDTILKKDPDHGEALLLSASILLKTDNIDKSHEILLRLEKEGIEHAELYLLMASVHQLKDDDKTAKSWIKAGLKKHPDSIALLISMAQTDIKEKNYGQVKAWLERIVLLEPGSMVYRTNLARLYVTTGEMTKAETLLNSMIDADPSNPDKRMAVADFWESQNQSRKSIKLLEEGTRKSPCDFRLKNRLGKLYLKTGDLTQADTFLTHCLSLIGKKADPEHINTQVVLATVCLARAELNRAESLVDKVIKADPKNSDAHRLKGKLLLLKGYGSGAVAEFRVVVNDRPDLPEGYMGLARAHVQNLDFDLALDVLKTVYKKQPESDEVLKAIIKVTLLKKDIDTGEKLLKQRAGSLPGNPLAVEDLGDFYVSQKRYGDALNQYQLLKKIPDQPLAYIKTALVLSKSKQFDKALEELKAGYQEMPDSAELLSSLIDFYLARGMHPLAEALCAKRIQINEKDGFTWNLIGKTYLKQNRLDNARNAFKTAIELNPQWPDPHNNLAKIHLIKGDTQSAISSCKTTLKTNNKNQTAWLTLGNLYEHTKSFDNAIQTYTEALGEIPELWAAANNLAFLLSEFKADKENLAKAYGFAKRAEALKPGLPIILDTLGWIHYKMGDVNSAVAALEKALADNPENVVMNYHMGAVLHELGRGKEAELRLKKALASGNDFYGRKRAQELYTLYNKGS